MYNENLPFNGWSNQDTAEVIELLRCNRTINNLYNIELEYCHEGTQLDIVKEILTTCIGDYEPHYINVNYEEILEVMIQDGLYTSLH